MVPDRYGKCMPLVAVAVWYHDSTTKGARKMDPKKPKTTLNFSLDYRFVVGVLVAIIAAMLLLWQPWNPRIDANARTVEVTGTAKLTAVPDEFLFYPNYEFKSTDKNVAITDLSQKSDEIVKKLKELGVPDNKIKTNANGNTYPYHMQDDSDLPVYMLGLTITVNDKDVAQKVQDYLVTTAPTGGITPQPQFSDAKRKELENQARDQATREARSKAEQSAKNLGFRLAAVKSVNDGAGFGGGVVPLIGRDSTAMNAAEPSKLVLQPGENDLNYSVTVTYFLK